MQGVLAIDSDFFYREFCLFLDLLFIIISFLLFFEDEKCLGEGQHKGQHEAVPCSLSTAFSLPLWSP